MVSFDGLHNRVCDCRDVVLSIGRELSATLLGLSQIGLDPSSEELERHTHSKPALLLSPQQLCFGSYNANRI